MMLRGKNYVGNMERYLDLRRQRDSHIPTVRVASTDKEESDEKITLPDANIVEHIPKTMRLRATALLNRLKERPDVISRDKSGQVSPDGEKIPQFNISDLISDALRVRKGFNPKGAREFFRVLSKMDMPKDLVRNERRWKQMNIPSSGEEEEVLYRSPTRTSPKRKKQMNIPSSGEEEVLYRSPKQTSSSSNFAQTLLNRHNEKAKQTQKRCVKY